MDGPAEFNHTVVLMQAGRLCLAELNHTVVLS